MGAEDERQELAGEGISEEGDLGALNSAGFGVGGGEEVRGVGVCEELGDDAGFGDYGAIVGDCRDEAALLPLVLISLWLAEGMSTGFTSRYQGSRGVSRSMMTSSYCRPSSLRAMWAR